MTAPIPIYNTEMAKAVRVSAHDALLRLIDHAGVQAETGPMQHREFWRRLAGSLRKGLTIVD